MPANELMAHRNQQMTQQPKKENDMNANPMFAESIATLNLDPIKIKLMDKKEGKGWDRAQADAAEGAYKQFLQLNLKFPNKSIVPTITIDAFWHQHILDTQSHAQPSRKHPALEKSDLAKLKYLMLVQIEKKESAKLKPWMSMEVSVEQIQNELLNEKLVEMADDRFELTELGRRFIREFKQVNESEK